MAGQEIEGGLWDQSLGLDLLSLCYQLSRELASGPCPSPLCKIWGAETHV